MWSWRREESRAIDAAVNALEGSGHEGISLDVSDPRDWEDAAVRIDAGGKLHGLVTAAGILGPIGSLEDLAPADLIETIAVNLIGTMLALRFALPRLRPGGGRAVTFSGGGGTSPLPRYDAYAASKAAVVRLTENLAADGEIEINAVAPGFVATRMHDGTLQAGPEAAGQRYYERTRQQLRGGGFPPSEAAELVAFLLGPEAAGISGRLISAQWDPWREEAFRERRRTRTWRGCDESMNSSSLGSPEYCIAGGSAAQLGLALCHAPNTQCATPKRRRSRGQSWRWRTGVLGAPSSNWPTPRSDRRPQICGHRWWSLQGSRLAWARVPSGAGRAARRTGSRWPPPSDSEQRWRRCLRRPRRRHQRAGSGSRQRPARIAAARRGCRLVPGAAAALRGLADAGWRFSWASPTSPAPPRV